jgi:hypothetical protein
MARHVRVSPIDETAPENRALGVIVAPRQQRLTCALPAAVAWCTMGFYRSRRLPMGRGPGRLSWGHTLSHDRKGHEHGRFRACFSECGLGAIGSAMMSASSEQYRPAPCLQWIISLSPFRLMLAYSTRRAGPLFHRRDRRKSAIVRERISAGLGWLGAGSTR